MIKVRPEALQEFTVGVISAMGAETQIADEVARHLVLSNLSGHDSHGVMRIPLYIEMVDSGALHPGSRPEIIRETPVSVLVDAHRGFGQYSTYFTLERCLEKAASTGLAVGAVRHSTHTGRMGTYPEAAAARGFVCIATVGSAGPAYGLVAPFGGAGRFLSTNPWTVGIPAGSGAQPFLFDAATSTIAEGKNKLAQWKRLPVAEGLVLDAGGRPTTDPNQLYEGGTLTPLGGAQAGHKGYGFSLAAALLGSMAMIGAPDPTPAGALRDFNGAAGAFLVVIDPGLFGDREEHAALVARTLGQAKQVPPAPGVTEVLHAGEPEQRSRAERSRDGVPIPDDLWAEFGGIGARFGVPLPAPA